MCQWVHIESRKKPVGLFKNSNDGILHYMGVVLDRMNGIVVLLHRRHHHHHPRSNFLQDLLQLVDHLYYIVVVTVNYRIDY